MLLLRLTDFKARQELSRSPVTQPGKGAGLFPSVRGTWTDAEVTELLQAPGTAPGYSAGWSYKPPEQRAPNVLQVKHNGRCRTLALGCWRKRKPLPPQHALPVAESPLHGPNASATLAAQVVLSGLCTNCKAEREHIRGATIVKRATSLPLRTGLNFSSVQTEAGT